MLRVLGVEGVCLQHSLPGMYDRPWIAMPPHKEAEVPDESLLAHSSAVLKASPPP